MVKIYGKYKHIELPKNNHLDNRKLDHRDQHFEPKSG
jgi:hypothetical protein